ncbi:F0F1 ATP synthase subunit A [Chlorobium phaeovibrioides]|uniref:ATP synthase subunit a n=2 Tax=Chlorobium phaeovibrioides TaxID=1094 RepID=A0A5M8ICZ9_CHLPH|nr:F0F1 ATP synthase subunit A [Chlorobium phaeovibrioides]HCD35752.1 ATP synthase F0 subunit A [Chlorobium sp.]KAA6233276.1 F0F1 ATP synthase subunit A [Chlorobium phaeovibrioides]MWV55166.1 F0F1 ATP synthase subunit A [Chlorobium phaeovibrioides]QEQ56316.1 F0F1 ATP synthase subunit A [Chlorobium phaeovibrioides]RTY36682.1 F0F1 ATP synthase subunit A [Chlorobium phaeovibrioides]
MKREKVIQAQSFLKVLALLVPLLLNAYVPASASDHAAGGVHAAAVHADSAMPAADGGVLLHGTEGAANEAVAHEEEKAGDVIMHHILDSHVFAFEPFGEIHLPRLPLLFGIDISITKHVVMLWIVSVILLVVFAAVGGTYKKMTARQAPGGLANAMEALVEFIRLDVAKSNIGHGYEKHLPYLLTVFMFILLCNLLGLIPYGATATGNINVTLTLAVFTFFITQTASLKAHGLKGYLQHLTAGTHWSLWIIMIPIEVIGLFTKPFALTVRLFANMTAGHIVILSLIFISFILKSYIVAAAVSVPFSIFIYLLEIFVAFLQAFIFTMLSALFIGLATVHEGGDAEVAHH